MDSYIGYGLITATFGSSVLLIAYESHARARGWPVGEFLVGDASIVKLIALLSVIGSLGISFYLFRWWSPIVVLLAGTFLGHAATAIFKSWVQIVSLVTMVVGWIACIFLMLNGH